jgi:hypothetical protein
MEVAMEVAMAATVVDTVAAIMPPAIQAAAITAVAIARAVVARPLIN